MFDTKNKQIMISTISSRLPKAKSLAVEAYKTTGIRSLISCQTFESVNYPDVEEETVEYVIIFSQSKGLANNRNNALQASKAKYIWILDDDVEIIPDGCIQGFKELENGEHHILTTCFKNDLHNENERYKKLPFNHNKISIMKVCSIEIFCDREALFAKNINFDSRFGLGAKFSSGEENVFLSDCLKSGLNVMFKPIFTASHPSETSGGNYNSNLQVVSKGAIIKRIFGLLGFPLVIVFFLKRVKNRDIQISQFIPAVFYGFKGFFKI